MKTIPSHIADAKGRTVLTGLRVLWSSSFIWSSKVLTIFTSHIPVSPQVGLVDPVPGVREREFMEPTA